MVLLIDAEVDDDYAYHVDALRSLLPDEGVRRYHYPSEGERPSLEDVDALVVSGSTGGVYEDDPWMRDAQAFVRDVVAEGIPTLGICFGHQLVNAALGGRVEHRGLTTGLVRVDFADDPLFDGVGGTIPAVHGDHVVERGDGMAVVGSADYYENFATRHRDAPVWTVQYHPEFTADLQPRLEDDFGWTASDLSYDDVTAVRTVENFLRLADVR